MQLAYYDEAGDDGYPRYASPFFVLSAIYLHYLNWKASFDVIRDFRRQLKSVYGFPMKTEMHTRPFLLNKLPYLHLNLNDADRVAIVGQFCDMIGSLDARIVNVVVVKPRIRNAAYEVLDTALTYSIQRIENDMNPSINPDAKFMIITDPGREGKMRKTSRRVQRLNFIPSKYHPGTYRRDVRSLIEDPLPKESSESYFIQISDLVSYVVYLYTVHTTGIGAFPNRLSSAVTPAKVLEWMERLKPSLNLKACSTEPYGIVYHPTK